MKSMLLGRTAVALTLAGLLTPALMVATSPALPEFVSSMLSGDRVFATEWERLRRATPSWSGAIQLFNTALYRLGTSPDASQQVLGRDGFLFLGDMHAKSYSQATHRYVASDEEVSNWSEVLQHEVAYAQKRGIKFLFVVAPSQPTIYQDKIRDIPSAYLKAPSTFDKVLALARERQLPLLDVRPELVAARSEADTYSKANSHWTDYGAWVAWKKALVEIRRQFPIHAFPAPIDPVRIETVYSNNETETMLGIKMSNPWTIPIFDKPLAPYSIVDREGNLIERPGAATADVGELPITTVSAVAPNKLTALVPRDSQGNALSQYFQQAFQTTHQVNHHISQANYFNLPGLIEQYRPDMILYIMTERYFAFPLGDLEYWRLATEFDESPPETELRWSASQRDSTLDFTSSGNASDASALRVPASGGSGGVLRVSVEGVDAGELFVGYSVAGQNKGESLRFGPGQNEFFVRAPENADYDTMWLKFAQGSGSIASIALRSKP